MRKISLIIVTYNSSKHIYECLDSIFNFNDIGDELEIIVVDNDSPEQKSMFDGISEKYGDKVLLISSEKNGGYGYGNNLGVSKASAPIIIVMNPDVRLVQPIFQKILIIMRKETIGIMGVSFVDGSLPFYYKPEYVSLYRELFHKMAVKKRSYNDQTMYMSGSFLVFRKKTFHKVGAFDENIFMYYEEPDITNRIQKAGLEAIWLSDIYVKHLAHGRSFNRGTEDIKSQSLKYYSKKYNVDIRLYLRVQLRVYKIKRLAALLLRNDAKCDYFDKAILYEKDLLSTL